MKITDLSLIFIAVILPMIIVVYVNVSFTIKAQEQEIYYKKIIDVASEDASNKMKEVENSDITVDYGYSGTENNKISVNAQVAVDTFLNNLYNNFGISGNKAAQRYLQLFVPAMAIIDYNGVQISSIEEYSDNGNTVMEHALKPKVAYSYDYTIVENGGLRTMVSGYTDTNAISWHHIEFTMDDFITHRGSYKHMGRIYEYDTKTFYITDDNNNLDLYDGMVPEALNIKPKIIETLTNMRKEVIVNTVVKEITYAINKNNSYARNAGITYNFVFPTTSQEDMYSTVENVGFLAFVQGLNVGNKYLNAKAYNITSLELATRYYFSVPNTDCKYQRNLYHKDESCPEYKLAMQGVDKILPKFSLTKQQSASQIVKVTFSAVANQAAKMAEAKGFYPCPVCNP